jgi:orotate phosphoribosyltransferase
MLSEERILEILKETKVMLQGHFLLTSGRHSDTYMQCAKLFEHSTYSELLCKELAQKFEGKQIDLVIGPAIGGIIISYEVSRALKVKNIFAERENGKMVLRRGFEIPKGARVLVVEDVVTTGGSVEEVASLVKHHGGEVVGIGVMVDRSNGRACKDYNLKAVLAMEVVSYEADDCPLCKQGKDYVKPGSRNIK